MSTATSPQTAGYTLATGRRKTAVARIRIKAGSGKIEINERTVEDYFPTEKDRFQVLDALNQTGKLNAVDVSIRVHGGGPTGQAGACKLGLARALRIFDSELDEMLRHSGLLTRDGRMKEAQKIRSAWRPTRHAVLEALSGFASYAVSWHRSAWRLGNGVVLRRNHICATTTAGKLHAQQALVSSVPRAFEQFRFSFRLPKRMILSRK